MTYLRINPVLALLLLLTAIAAALPFISYAPNRLVSGEGRHLWQLWPQTLWMLVGVGCAWLTACFIPAKKAAFLHSFWRNSSSYCWCGELERRRHNWRKMAVRWHVPASAVVSGWLRRWHCWPVAMPSAESPRIRCGAGCCICRLPLFRCGCCTPARLTISR